MNTDTNVNGDAIVKSVSSGRKALSTIGGIMLAMCCFIAVKAMTGGFSAPEKAKFDGAAAISGQSRASFVKLFDNTCLKTQRASAQNKGVADEKIRQYCSCLSDAVANETTNLDMLTATPVLSVAQQNRITRLGNSCKSRL